MPQLYLPYANGICEVSKISGSKGRTWFIGDDKMAGGYDSPQLLTIRGNYAHA